MELLICPKTGEKLVLKENCLESDNGSVSYPIVNGIPILIDEDTSIFKFQDFLSQKDTTFDTTKYKLKALAKKYLPSISKNLKAKKNFIKYSRLLLEKSPNPRVLVIGCGIPEAGIQPLLESEIELVETDVSFGPRTKLIADAHRLPFMDNSFDGVIAQAVLEHVVDPYQCVSEMHRVLNTEGLVYAETPFMQQVHMAPYDFTRFTHLGHRRLFRNFTEIESGAALGPAMAFAWSYMYFLLSFSKSRKVRYALMLFAHLTAFWIKYFDYFLINKPGSMDAACGYYFFYKKLDTAITDTDLFHQYKGANL